MHGGVVAGLRPRVAWIASEVTKPARASAFRRAAERQGPPHRIIVGSSTVQRPGWLSTDVHVRAKYYLDATKEWPLRNGSVEAIYADNVIEHFILPIGRMVLKHAYDALQPGGHIRLATPDVGRTAAAYLNDPGFTEQHLARHRRMGYVAEHPVDLLRVVFNESGHHRGYCYDQNALTAELANAGFDDIRRCETSEGRAPYLCGLENRTDATDLATMLIVEATKPLGDFLPQ